MKKIIVLVKNKSEFWAFIREVDKENRKLFLPVNRPEHTMGIEALAVISVGNYYEIENYYKLKNLAHTRVR